MVGPPGLLVEGCLHPRLAVFAYPINDVVQTLQANNHQDHKKTNKKENIDSKTKNEKEPRG